MLWTQRTGTNWGAQKFHFVGGPQFRGIAIHFFTGCLPSELAVAPVERGYVRTQHLVQDQYDVFARNDRTRRMSHLIREGAKRRLPALRNAPIPVCRSRGQSTA